MAGGRFEFKESLRVKNPAQVPARYGELHAKYDAIFEQLRDGIALADQKTPDLSILKLKASAYKLPYKSVDEQIAQSDMRDMLTRIGVWTDLGKPEGPEMDAIFGSKPNDTTLKQVLEFYEEQTRAELIGLSKRETNKRRGPPRLAIDRFIAFVGHDPIVSKITRAKAQEYRSHLIDHIENGEMNEGTANKQIMHIRKILTHYIDSMGLDFSNPFAGVRFKEEQKARPAFTVPFIKKIWLEADDPFASLNDEASGALFAMLDTGCGAKEISGLDPTEIRLDAEIPHIVVQPNKHRKLKTSHRGRSIPLVGQSLLAFQANPNGFPSYRRSSGADALSGVIMKHLKTNKLLETDKHSTYGLRHMFMDRMRKHKIPEELQNYLMGHKHPTMGAHYGSGYELADIQSYLERLAGDWI
ncbi:MAG: hypothetical protein KDJ29_05090 [Hyphomicrobiales bacterium]|nr:hypothetical protein [Hyphomicrobiales bacterium]